MHLTDVADETLRAGIAALGARFYTKDLSGTPDMLAVHSPLPSTPRYHTVIGKYLALIQGGWVSVVSPAVILPEALSGNGSLRPHRRLGRV